MRGGIVIAGPTGAGKSDLSMSLVDRLADSGRAVEIVSADAVSIYRELEIGTAKPSREFRAKIPHHLMDIRSIADSARPASETAAPGAPEALTRPAYSAGEFARDFFELLPRLPEPALVVGGTGFYIDAAVRGLATTPPANAAIRNTLAREETSRPGALYEHLFRLDSAAAKKIGPANIQRLIRAIEVCELTGRKFSEHIRRPTDFKPTVFVLMQDRDKLYRSIELRARRMFSTGLPQEVEALLRRFPPDLPAFAAPGYAETVRWVTGKCSIEDAVTETIRRTCHLAKRQLTWWRHFRYEQVCFIQSPASPEDLLSKWKEHDPCSVSSFF